MHVPPEDFPKRVEAAARETLDEVKAVPQRGDAPTEICERTALYCLQTCNPAPCTLKNGCDCTCGVCQAEFLITSQAAEIERLTKDRDSYRAWFENITFHEDDDQKIERRLEVVWDGDDSYLTPADDVFTELQARALAAEAALEKMREAGRYMLRVVDAMRKDPRNTHLAETDRVFLMVEMSSDICDEDAARAALTTQGGAA